VRVALTYPHVTLRGGVERVVVDTARHLVRAGHEVHLLAMGEGGVTQLRTYLEPEARALGLLEDEVVEVHGAAKIAPLGKLLDGLRSKTVIK
jgi:hypothetical protein